METKVITGDKAMSDSLKAAQKAGAVNQMISVAKGEQLSATKFTGVVKGAKGEPFSHPNEQVTVILSGHVEFHLGDEVLQLKAGDAVFVPANVVHYGICMEDDSSMIDIFSPPRKYMD